MSKPDLSNDDAVETFIANYRRAIADLESQTTEPGSEEWRNITKRLRQFWADWQGEDSLHKMAFGEPN